MLPPPEGNGSTGDPRQDAMSPEGDDAAKAKLDDTELNVGSPRAMQKVELDLDDAPFLQDDEPAPPPPQAAPERETSPQAEAPLQLPVWKRKKVLIGAGAGLLILVGFLVWWLFLRSTEPPPPPPPPTPPPVQEPPKPVEPPPPPPPQDIYVPLEAFVVEKIDEKGVAKVLTLKLKLVYKENPMLERELLTKNFALRDGLYYNLKNKSFANLTDKDSVEQLREELRGVVNNYLNTGQVEQVLFEELLVK